MKYLDYLKDYTCTLIRDDKIVASSKAIGIKPILDVINSGIDASGCIAIDKIVGKAAALLYIYMGVSKVYAEVMSKAAEEILKAEGIVYEYETLVEKIINRRGDDICPMEKAVIGIDTPEKALKAVSRRVKELSGKDIENVKVVLFDLDGTLLPMDQDVFVKDYFGRLAKHLAPHGYDPKQLIDTVWKGTRAMVKNDGSCTNEAAFWKFFATVYGEKGREDEPLFAEFYRKEFDKVRASCGFRSESAEWVRELKAKGYRVALATNPIFPAMATEARIRWAGLEPSDFELYTTYENSTFCKPAPNYYFEVADKLGVKPEECLMVGNDVEEDMDAASEAGMAVRLLPDCLICRREGYGYENFEIEKILKS